MGIVDTLTALISILDSSCLNEDSLVSARQFAHKALLESKCLVQPSFLRSSSIVPSVDNVVELLDTFDMQTSTPHDMCIRLQSEVVVLQTLVDELKAENKDMKKKIEKLETKIEKLEVENKEMKIDRTDWKERAVIRTIAINLEYEIKEEALLLMDKQKRLRFYRGEYPTMREVSEAKLHMVIDMLNLDQHTMLMQRWFGVQNMSERYDSFREASWYMKASFHDDAHPTQIYGKNVVLVEAKRLVEQVKMHEEWRQEPHSSVETFMKETVIDMLDHLAEVRRHKRQSRLLF